MSDEPSSPQNAKFGVDDERFRAQDMVRSEVDSRLERKLIRKLDMVVLPWTCVLYLLAYLDRSNLGNARLQGLPDDILGGDPTGTKFDWVSSIFYFASIMTEIPAVITSKLFRPRIWIGIATIGWGMASTLQATAFNFSGLLVARFCLGVLESAFVAMLPLYLTFFYTRHEIGVRLAIWSGFSAVAGAFGGLIAYGIQHIDSHIANWRILFLVEGLPTIVFGIFTLFMLPDRPDTTKWLQGAEKDLAIERMSRGGLKEKAGTINRSHIIAALTDWRIYITGVLYFGPSVAHASIGVFLPTIIKSFGYTNANAQLLTVPPYAVAVIFMIITSYSSDRLQSRGVFICVWSSIGALGYLLLLVIPSNQSVRYFAIFLCCAGTYTTVGIALSWFSHNLGSESKKAAGIPLIIVFGHCGAVLGTHSYPSSEGPRYIKGLALSCGLLFLSALLSLVLTASFRRENARRDRVYGRPEEGKVVDTQKLADRTPEFRYVP